ncbi:MAG TPA: universal stress protein [Anaerolineales bacterium]
MFDTPQLQHPLNIMLAIDGSEHSRAAISLLCDLPLPANSTITALAVLDPQHTAKRMTLMAILDETQSILQGKGVEVATGILHGSPAGALTKFADDNRPDLIVMGAKGLRATLGILLGGVSQQMVEYARWPVLVVRAPYTGLKRVLLVTDGSDYSRQALDYLAQFSLPAQAEVHVLHVLPPLPSLDLAARAWPVGADILPAMVTQSSEEIRAWEKEEESEGQGLLDRTLAALRAAGINAEGHMQRGDAATEIIEFVKLHSIDLIVAGSRGLSQMEGWLLGSVSRKLLHYSGCSVLVVKGEPKNS